jgi:hypothetical protein
MISSRRFIIIVVWLATFGSSLAGAQSQPAGLSVSPGVVYKPPGTPYCYTMYVSGGANMTVDIRWKFPGGADQYIYGWPQLNGSGQAYICTDSLTAVAQHIITGVRNSATPSASFVSVYAVIDVRATPPQPTTLTFNSSSGYAGNDSYTLHVNGSNMTVNLKYTLNGVIQPDYSLIVNGNGDWFYTLNHYDGQGVYRFTKIKNANRSDWADIDVSYTVKAPKPISATISPSTVAAGQGSYTLTAGNGANIYADMRYTFDSGSGDGPLQTQPAFAFLSPVSSGSPDGKNAISVGACKPPGIYTYRWIKNSSNDDTTWVAINAVLNVTTPPAPSITSVNPSASLPNRTVNVTITGVSFCGATLSTSYPGLTITSTPPAEPATTISAAFTIASSALPGNAIVVVSTTRGTASFQFAISSSSPPSISSVSPSSCNPGSAVQITMTGSNLFGAALSTSYTGLSFSNISSQSNTLTAQLNASASTPLGTPVITVTTPGGSTTMSAFSITSSNCVSGGGSGPSSAKEYVYFGGRVLAVESWSLTTPPPGPPIELSGQALDTNTVQLNWQPATPAPGTNISSYQIKRGGTVIATVGASQLSYLDTSAAQNTTYTFAAVSRDNTIPSPLVSVNSNSATITTPGSTIPPTTPNITNLEGYWIEDWWCFGVGVSWTPSTAYGGAVIARYVLFADGQEVYSGPETTTGFYTYGFNSLAVYAVDNAGNWSQPGRWP